MVHPLCRPTSNWYHQDSGEKRFIDFLPLFVFLELPQCLAHKWLITMAIIKRARVMQSVIANGVTSTNVIWCYYEENLICKIKWAEGFIFCMVKILTGICTALTSLAKKKHQRRTLAKIIARIGMTSLSKSENARWMKLLCKKNSLTGLYLTHCKHAWVISLYRINVSLYWKVVTIRFGPNIFLTK